MVALESEPAVPSKFAVDLLIFVAEKVVERRKRIKNKKPGVGGNTGFDPFEVQQ